MASMLEATPPAKVTFLRLVLQCGIFPESSTLPEALLAPQGPRVWKLSWDRPVAAASCARWSLSQGVFEDDEEGGAWSPTLGGEGRAETGEGSWAVCRGLKETSRCLGTSRPLWLLLS